MTAEDAQRLRDLLAEDWPDLRIVPSTIRAANAKVAEWHRHHKPPQGALWALAVERVRDGVIVGVAIAGIPKARMVNDGKPAGERAIEIVRVATDGTRNACSMLYGACARAARALGWASVITYTLPSEGGASLRAAGWVMEQRAGGGEWTRAGRERPPAENPEEKFRWRLTFKKDREVA